MSWQFKAPEPLTSSHRVDEFQCGEASLDNWLKKRALVNQLSGASRTFVVVDQDQQVFGYYAMVAGAVAHQIASSSVRRNAKLFCENHGFQALPVHPLVLMLRLASI